MDVGTSEAIAAGALLVSTGTILYTALRNRRKDEKTLVEDEKIRAEKSEEELTVRMNDIECNYKAEFKTVNKNVKDVKTTVDGLEKTQIVTNINLKNLMEQLNVPYQEQ